MPLARGGTNHRRNIQILCPSCNLRKGWKHPIDFAQEMGRLL
jgi:5-methylcytosine-specific restriction endonuclease McrA